MAALVTQTTRETLKHAIEYSNGPLVKKGENTEDLCVFANTDSVMVKTSINGVNVCRCDADQLIEGINKHIERKFNSDVVRFGLDGFADRLYVPKNYKNRYLEFKSMKSVVPYLDASEIFKKCIDNPEIELERLETLGKIKDTNFKLHQVAPFFKPYVDIVCYSLVLCKTVDDATIKNLFKMMRKRVRSLTVDKLQTCVYPERTTSKKLTI